MPDPLDLGLASNLGTAKMPAVRIAVAADALKMFDARRSVGIASKAVIGFMLPSWESNVWIHLQCLGAYLLIPKVLFPEKTGSFRECLRVMMRCRAPSGDGTPPSRPETLRVWRGAARDGEPAILMELHAGRSGEDLFFGGHGILAERVGFSLWDSSNRQVFLQDSSRASV